MKIIYVITTIEKITGDAAFGCRAPGWYENLDEAVRAVEENIGDIFESGTYPYCVIEAMAEGIYGYMDEFVWFVWEGDEKTGGYKRIITNPLPRTCGFGIG